MALSGALGMRHSWGGTKPPEQTASLKMDIPVTIERYFESGSRRDVEAILALFREDAVVIDDGRTWHGSADIRAWQLGPASQYEYTVTLSGIEATGAENYLVSCRLDGNFPGGTVELRFRFILFEDLIERLEIAP
jgi:ketosteroid isomerase-like protein